MKNKMISMIFLVFVGLLMLLNIVSADQAISNSERRNLFTLDELKWSNHFSEDFETYALDQFAFRDYFRKLKGIFDSRVFLKLDNNGLYSIDDWLFKLEYPLNEDSVLGVSEKINKIYDLYLMDNHHVYYSIIPDKNYYVDDKRYLKMDYDKLEKIMDEKIYDQISYVNLFNSLSLTDYYKTDHHWKQNSLSSVIDTLSESMDFTNLFDLSKYELKTYSPFYGAYYGQSAVPMEAEELIYLSNDQLSKIRVDIVTSFTDSMTKEGVYDQTKLDSIDSYNMFLYGSLPIVTLTNKNAASEKELIIFKDSFSNSLAPLLIESYEKITLIDLRLVHHQALKGLVDFKDSDVLFLYSSLVINQSEILK